MREAILDLLLKNGATKIKEISKSLDVESADIMDTLRELRSEGFISFNDGAYSLQESKEEAIEKAINELKGKLSVNIKPLAEFDLKKAVLDKLSNLLDRDISAVLKSIASDLEEYQKLGDV